ncbi:MAG: hypothetical protein ACXAE3_11075, partial [Candidatus Kariarchaeaceae archaeon]
MSLYDKFIAELRLIGFDNQWITNHISIIENEGPGDTDIRFTFNYFSKEIAERLHEFSIASRITTVEYVDVDFSLIHHLTILPNLTTLQLRYYYFFPFFDGGSSRRRVDRKFTLPSFPSLQTLIIEEIYPEELVKIDYSMIPEVNRLSLTINSSLNTALHHITLPPVQLEHLRSLSIKYIGNIELPADLVNLKELERIRVKTTSITHSSQNLLARLSESGV